MSFNSVVSISEPHCYYYSAVRPGWGGGGSIKDIFHLGMRQTPLCHPDRQIREISPLLPMLSFKWSSRSRNQSSSNLTSSSISLCPGGAWVGVGMHPPTPQLSEEGKEKGVCQVLLISGVKLWWSIPNCQHPQSHKTQRTCAPAPQSKHIISRTTSMRKTQNQSPNAT